MIMNGNKLRTHVNMALNMNHILLKITSADRVSGRDEGSD